MKKRLSTVILLLVLFIGLSLLLYPTVSDWWNSYHQSRVIDDYMQNIANIDNEEYEKMLSDAIEYNKSLATRENNFYELSEEEKELYNSMLNITGTGVMGYIEIPVLQQSIPVYHGTDPEVLAEGVGHIEGTSLPVGGESSHCVLSGHRGLPSAKLFTDINLLVVGDVFILHTLDTMYTYEVDKISKVLPNEINDLNITPGEDYCTLVTCTPYGINTHRLLVRGHRIDNEISPQTVRVTSDAFVIEPTIVAPFAAIPMLLILLILLFTTTGKHKKHKNFTGDEEQ